MVWYRPESHIPKVWEAGFLLSIYHFWSFIWCTIIIWKHTLFQIPRWLQGCSTERYIQQATSELLNCTCNLKEVFHAVKHPNLSTLTTQVHVSELSQWTLCTELIYCWIPAHNKDAQTPLHIHNSYVKEKFINSEFTFKYIHLLFVQLIRHQHQKVNQLII